MVQFPSPIGMIHGGVSVLRLLVRNIFLFLSFTTTSFLRNLTSIPLSHTTRTENRGLVISLKTFAFFRCGDSVGIPNYT